MLPLSTVRHCGRFEGIGLTPYAYIFFMRGRTLRTA